MSACGVSRESHLCRKPIILPRSLSFPHTHPPMFSPPGSPKKQHTGCGSAVNPVAERADRLALVSALVEETGWGREEAPLWCPKFLFSSIPELGQRPELCCELPTFRAVKRVSSDSNRSAPPGGVVVVLIPSPQASFLGPALLSLPASTQAARWSITGRISPRCSAGRGRQFISPIYITSALDLIPLV